MRGRGDDGNVDGQYKLRGVVRHARSNDRGVAYGIRAVILIGVVWPVICRVKIPDP